MTLERDKPRVDWVAVKAAYRTGIDSTRGIAREHGVTEGAIRKRAKDDGWSRDLTSQVKARAEQLVRAGTHALRTEQEAVESEAAVLATAEALQRSGTAKLFRIVNGLADELEQAASLTSLSLPQFRTALLRVYEDSNVITEQEVKAIKQGLTDLLDRGERTDTAKKLVDSWRGLVDVQRRILKLDAEGTRTPVMDALREMLHAG